MKDVEPRFGVEHLSGVSADGPQTPASPPYANPTDIRTSDRREWAFRPKDSDAIRQLYWWQGMGVYLVGSYDPEGGGLKLIGQFFEWDAAIAAALPNHPAQGASREPE